ncbi:MAG TPA: FAD-dependent oxidoreductase [Acidimicrobiales bacterium]|nr:FAD-dependent oxidoreductase [Acidimicrobiales bacterium]
MTQPADVVVVGAGAMGSATAWWLARAGRQVVLLDRHPRGHTLGSSHGGSRIFRLAYPHPAWVATAQEALGLWRQLEEEAGTELLLVRGGVDHGARPAVEAVASALAARGARHEMLSAAEAAQRWPGMRFRGPVCHQPDAGTVLADRAVHTLQERVADLGGLVRFSSPVTSVESDAGEIVVSCADDDFRAGAVVVTAGAWAPSLIPDLPGRPVVPPMTVTQEQTFHFAPAPSGAPTRWPSFIHHRSPVIYGLETPGEGVKVAEHMAGRVLAHPDDRFDGVDPAARPRVRTYVERWLPGLVPVPVTESTCLYTTTPDESFVITRRQRVVIGAGFSGHGFKFVPWVGRRLADLAEEALAG